MHLTALLTVTCSIAAAAAAQEASPQPPKRSLAEGLVRQRIEIDHLQPPRLESGLEIGAGEGPMVLLIRRADGTLASQEIERGRGDHGPAAEPNRVDEPEEVEAAQQDKPTLTQLLRPAKPPTIRLVGGGEQFTLSIEPGEELTGAAIERAVVLPRLQRLFATTKDTWVEGQLVLELNGDALMQDVLTLCAIVREAGFDGLMLSGMGSGTISDDDRALLAQLPTKYGWQIERFGGGQQRICSGELLILLDGPARWRDVGALYKACAEIGIWQIAFAGQKDPRTRFKLPLHLPFDRGR